MGKPEKLTFRFVKGEGYRVVPANGVWGGPTPRGDIRVDFFYENQAIPETVTQVVNEDGTLGETEKDTELGLVTRTLMVGLMLTPEQAESIGKWLQDKARTVRALRDEAARTAEGAKRVTEGADTPTKH